MKTAASEDLLFETALIEAVPSDARRIHLIQWTGNQAAHARACRRLRDLRADLMLVDSDEGAVEIALFPSAIPHTSDAPRLLRLAHNGLQAGGLALAVFRNGTSKAARETFLAGDWMPPGLEGAEASALGEYSPAGVAIVLSRAAFDVEEMIAVPVDACAPQGAGPQDTLAWVVTARARTGRVSPFGEERRQRRERAKALNEEGEACYAAGDVMGATTAFAKAIDLWNEEAVFFNNLATALFALGYYDECWRRVSEALHLNPNLRMARDNLRAIAQAFGRSEEAERLLQLFGRD